MLSEVQGLGADERGFVLGVLGVLRGRGGLAGLELAGPGGDRCLAALAAVEALPADALEAERQALAAEIAAPLPAGLALVHPGWLRRVLEGERSDVVRAVTRGAPAEVRRVADELVAARGDATGRDLDGPGLPDLRRAVFAALAPMPVGEGGPPEARALCGLPLAALLDELDRRGATALGLALAGAPDPTVARAAAGAGEPFARVLLEAARTPGPPEARARARALVARVPPAEAARGAVRAVGLRAVARALAPEGGAALLAVAQRLPPAVGDALLACALEDSAAGRG